MLLLGCSLHPTTSLPISPTPSLLRRLLEAAQWILSLPPHIEHIFNLSLSIGARIDDLAAAKAAVIQAKEVHNRTNTYQNTVFAELGRRIETMHLYAGGAASFRQIAAQTGVGLRTAHRAKTWYQLCRCLPGLLVAPNVRHTFIVNNSEAFRKQISWMMQMHPDEYAALRSAPDVKFVSSEVVTPMTTPAPITNIIKVEGVDDARIFGFGSGELSVFGKTEADEMREDIPDQVKDAAIRTAFGPIEVVSGDDRANLLEQIAPATPCQPYDNSADDTAGVTSAMRSVSLPDAVPYAVSSGNPNVPVPGLATYLDVSRFQTAPDAPTTGVRIQVILVAGGQELGPYTVNIPHDVPVDGDTIILSYTEMALTEMPGYEANEALVWAVNSLSNECTRWEVYTQEKVLITSTDSVENGGNYYLAYKAGGAAEAIDLVRRRYPRVGPSQVELLQNQVTRLQGMLEAVMVKIDAEPLKPLKRPAGRPPKGHRWDEYRGYVKVVDTVDTEVPAHAAAPV